MPREQIIEIFKQGTLPQSPQGYSRGTAIFYPGTKRALILKGIARMLWQGKAFLGEGIIRNRWFGFNIFKGRTYTEASWLDGKPALIIDYAGMSGPFEPFRDELREIGPGLILGRFYFKEDRKYICHFTLELPK